MKLTAKRIIAAAASLTLAAGVVAGASVSGVFGNDTATSKNSSVVNSAEQKKPAQTEQTGSVNVENAIAEGEGEGTDDVTNYEHPLQETYPNLNVVDETKTDLRNQLLYGNSGKTEDDYFMGKAAFFSIFAKNVTLTETVKDVEGRIAADEFDTSIAEAYGVGGGFNTATKLAGSADVICNNDNLGWFGYTNAKYKSTHNFVFSPAVQEIKGSTTSTENGSNLYVADGIIDFDAEFAKLEALSAKLATADANLGLVQVTGSDVTVTGKDDKVNVFTFTKEQWDGFAGKNLKFDVPTGSFIIVNIAGSDVRFDVNMFINGVSIAQGSTNNCYVMLNFYEAENVDVATAAPRGTILAPKARVSTSNNQHVDGQVIAETVHLNYEQGFTTFDMPADYADEITYDNVVKTKFTAHYVYFGADGVYHEINNSVYSAPDSLSLMNAFDDGDKKTVLGKDAFVPESYNYGGSKDGVYNKSEYTLVWDVYKDGKDITGATEGEALLDPNGYEGLGLTYVGTVDAGEEFAIDDSNVYFVARLVTKVNVDVTFIDGGNAEKRPDSIDFGFKGTVNSTDAYTMTGTIDTTELSDTEYQYNQDKYQGVGIEDTAISAELPVLDENGKVIKYDDKSYLTYEVPDGYTELNDYYTKVDKVDGVTTYHIVLKRTYDINFVVNDSPMTQNGFLDKLAGTESEGLPYPGFSAPNGFKVVWLDPVENKVYEQNTRVTYPAKDTTLYAQVVRDSDVSPRIYFNMITYKGSHYIKGNVVSGMMKYDGTTEDFVLEETIGGSDALKADKTNDYFMFSMVLGVDNDNVSKTRFTISTESLGSTEYIYDEEVEHGETSNLIDAFYVFGKNTATGKAGEALLGPDPFLNDSNGSNDGYDGYRQVRMVLPAEYANKTLYVNAYYYDEQGNQYLHGNYVLKMSANGFWTLK